MTAREIEILKAALDVAHDADGHQYEEAVLHAAVNCRLLATARLAATLLEFEAALGTAGTRGLLNRVVNRVTGRSRWNITDAGEAARLEM